MRSPITSRRIWMSMDCSRLRVEGSARESADQARPFGLVARQAQPHPSRLLFKYARPDARTGELLLRGAGVLRLIETEQRRAADKTPSPRFRFGIEPRAIAVKASSSRLGPIAIEQGAPSDRNRGTGNRPWARHHG